MSNPNKTQLRANCIVCNSFQAVDDQGRIARHGYRVIHGMTTSPCIGSGYVHVGHKDAPNQFDRILLDAHEDTESLKQFEKDLQEQLSDSAGNKARELKKQIRSVKGAIANNARFTAHIQERKADWTEREPVLVDYVEAKRSSDEVRQQRIDERERKRIEKEERAKVREAQKQARIQAFLEPLYRQITFKGVVQAEWQSGYESMREYTLDVRERVIKVQDNLKAGELSDLSSDDQLMAFYWDIEVVTRTKADGKGRKIKEPAE